MPEGICGKESVPADTLSARPNPARTHQTPSLANPCWQSLASLHPWKKGAPSIFYSPFLIVCSPLPSFLRITFLLLHHPWRWHPIVALRFFRMAWMGGFRFLPVLHYPCFPGGIGFILVHLLFGHRPHGHPWLCQLSCGLGGAEAILPRCC